MWSDHLKRLVGVVVATFLPLACGTDATSNGGLDGGIELPSMECPADAPENACGGCGALREEVGSACGPCAASRYECGPTGVRCPVEACACRQTAECRVGEECTAGMCAPEGFSWIPPGTFVMGEDPAEWYVVNRSGLSSMQHEVTITRGFLIGRTEVTVGQFERVDPDRRFSSFLCQAPCRPDEDETAEVYRRWHACGNDCPADGVEWLAALGFANARSVAEGLTPCYTLPDGFGDSLGVPPNEIWDTLWTDHTCTGYRLPTDAEWEYAARATSTRETYNGPLSATDPLSALELDPVADEIAWYVANSSPAPLVWGQFELDGTCGLHPVAQKKPNGWGLYDVAGNADEWVFDYWRWFQDDEAMVDPVHARYDVDDCGPDFCPPDPWYQGSLRVIRGGNGCLGTESIPHGSRWRRGYRDEGAGFRLVRGVKL